MFENLAMENLKQWSSNRKYQFVWLFKQLVFNLLIWNILFSVFIWMNFLVNPGFIENGAKIFKILHQNTFLSNSLISFVAISNWLLEDVIFRRFMSGRRLGSLFFMRILFFLAMLMFTFICASIIHYRAELINNTFEYFLLAKDFLFNANSAYLLMSGIFISILINFYKTIRQKIGNEKFIPFILGKYKVPKEENRIFIFIDLISSTKYAEQLGHKKYSLFLQDCFKFLGTLEVKYHAMHYQFIGDEVVLTWSGKKKRNYLFAVQFYYEYVSMLQKNSEYFLKKYNVEPKFTAAINSGEIMVAEVGTVKSEIAFHGEVLNTASRIQKQCKEYKRNLLFTQSFAIEFKEICPSQKVIWVDKIQLQGKKEAENIYTI